MSGSIKGMLADIREQHRKSDACPRHHYPHKLEGYRIGEKLTCMHCGVPASLVDVGNYIRGYMAAGGDPADIMPDWQKREAANGRLGVVKMGFR